MSRQSRYVNLTSFEVALSGAQEIVGGDDIDAQLFHSATVIIAITGANSAIGSLTIQQSIDGTYFYDAETVAYSIASSGVVMATYSPVTRYIRVKLANTSGSGTISSARLELKD